MNHQSEAAEIEREELRRQDRKPRLFRCSDRMCGGLDCANCYGESAALEFLAKQQEDDQ